MENIWKPRGTLNSQKPDAGGAVLRQVPMLGIVKDTVDPTRSGRIRVYISAIGGKDPDDEKNWTPVLYMSPYFGTTTPSGGKSNFGTFKSNPASYGMWYSPPDVGTTVVCLFINGDPNFGFYIGSVPETEALRMVPAMGANFTNEDVIFDSSEANSYGGATRLPVTNMNTNNSNQTNNSTFLNAPKPVHSFQASIMFQQGVLRDPIRGPISTSAQRESPSRVGWGVSSPGRPIYEGGQTDETITDAAANAKGQAGLKVVSRRGGHSIVMDDGDLIGQDNLVRIRTSLGHQILMSDDGQTMMFLHSNGQSYIELGKEGTVDVYSTNSINFRTNGDINLHADNNININAAKKLNIQADEININSENDINQKAGANLKEYTQGTYTHKVDGAMSMGSSGEASFASAGTTYINGSVINLNTGQSSTTPEKVPAISLTAQTDTLFDSIKGWAAAPGKLLTIVSRAPAHAPWANAGQGVDVKVNLNASSQLPSSPSQQVQSVNNNAATAQNVATPNIATVSTVPPVTAVSAAVDKNTTSAVISAAAVQAATGPAASAVKSGAGVVLDAAGQVAGVSVGKIGLSAEALQTSNVLKPGSANLINTLVKNGANVQSAMSSALFTGQSGAANLPSLLSNPQAQVNAVVNNLQQAQTALTQSGIMTGKESPISTAGMMLSSVTNGINATVNTIQNIAGNVGNAISGIANSVKGVANSVVNSISAGNFAAGLAGNLTSGLSGISKSISSIGSSLSGAIESAKGVAAGAFAAVTNSFKPFKAGIPQNLKAIAESNQQAAEEPTEAPDPYAGLNPEQLEKLGNSDPTDPFIRSRLGLPKLGGSPAAVSLASGINSLPGGENAIARVVNNATGAVNSIPGVAGVKSLINNSSTAAINGISLQSSLDAAKGLATKVTNLNVAGASDALNKLKAGSTNLTSLISSGLPAGAASQLNSAIASLSSGGALSIKMPTIATNTTDRGELTAAVSSLLPAGVPKPNFSGIPTAVKTALEAKQESNAETAKKVQDLNKEYDKQIVLVDQTEAAYFDAKRQFLAGDPQIQAAKAAWDAELKKKAEISKQITGAQGLNVDLPGLPGLQDQGNALNSAGAGLERLLRTNPFTGRSS
jgi:hypothetical protein